MINKLFSRGTLSLSSNGNSTVILSKSTHFCKYVADEDGKYNAYHLIKTFKICFFPG